MAEALNERVAEASSPVPPRRRYRRRFVIAYAVLGAALGGTAVGFWSLLNRPERTRPPATAVEFGQFRPTAEGVAGANQIAEFVGGRYRLPSGKQLVLVVAGRLEVQETPIPAIAIQDPNQGGQEGTQILPAVNTLVYSLCGLGKDCAIAEGTATAERGRLVRREALELALYTFAYLDDVDSVIAFLPPPPGRTIPRVVFFRRDELDDALDPQFREALVAGNAPLANDIARAEAMLIDRLTESRLFTFAFQQLQDGRPILVLQPLTARG